MQITSYQMHNVLECYRKKLKPDVWKRKICKLPVEKMGGERTLSPETSRMATMDKISQQVFDKVTDVVAFSNSPNPSRNETQENTPGDESVGEPATEEFTYHVMDSINRKRTARLPMGDPTALTRHLDQWRKSRRRTQRILGLRSGIRRKNGTSRCGQNRSQPIPQPPDRIPRTPAARPEDWQKSQPGITKEDIMLTSSRSRCSTNSPCGHFRQRD